MDNIVPKGTNATLIFNIFYKYYMPKGIANYIIIQIKNLGVIPDSH